MNQLGQAQAIGAVNEKIEGFFDICAARGLSGEQGVLIPAANIKHLMLRRDVVAAAEAGKFSIYAVENVDQAIALLTGMPAGEADANGNYPDGSVNRQGCGAAGRVDRDQGNRLQSAPAARAVRRKTRIEIIQRRN